MTNSIKTYLLLAVLITITLFAGEALGGEHGLFIALVMSLVMSFGSYWFSDSIVLSIYGARELSPREAPELHGIVEELAQAAGIPKPRVCLIPSASPNAFATGRGPGHAAVAVTHGILQTLSMRELRGVLAHEIAHIANYDVLLSTVVATLAGSLSMLSRMVFWFGAGLGSANDREDGQNPLLAMVMMILAPFVALLVQMAISRNREFLADETGARLSGDPTALASALARIHSGIASYPMRDVEPATSHMFILQPFDGNGLLDLFSTHPPVRERINRLYEMARSVSTTNGFRPFGFAL
ncbi:MAG: zinc metalloprotease HtpX [Syntrophothermus sp.]|uniref:zinc metalloprotease HtpX n=1 Tax=Syntrophothermus sp. TaxID=2736299 RepID=UPI00257FE971|nr:zinc metalloprotease HtpX [Syntrophothermus sp.]NSW84475.1 zinc metalloprotease HtpX [Syntrophothermus sp.]